MLRSRWHICLLVVVGAAICGALCFAVPAVTMRARRQHLITIVETAKSVRLEEFIGGGPVLAKHELDVPQRAGFVHQLWSLPTKGSALSHFNCFIPHHRIIAQSSDGSEFTWTVCFDCAQMTHTGTPDTDKFGLQKSVYDSLRILFVENGISVRTVDEYEKVRAEYVKTLNR